MYDLLAEEGTHTDTLIHAYTHVMHDLLAEEGGAGEELLLGVARVGDHGRGLCVPMYG